MATKRDKELVRTLAVMAKWKDDFGPKGRRPFPEAQAVGIGAAKAMAAIQAGDIQAAARWAFGCGYAMGEMCFGRHAKEAVKAMRLALEELNLIFPDASKRDAVEMFNKLLAQYKKADVAKPAGRATKEVCKEFGCCSRSLGAWRKSLATL